MSERIDSESKPWNEAALATPRQAVQTNWNGAVTRKHCKMRGNQLYNCRAEDTTKGRPLTLSEKYMLESRHFGVTGKRQRMKRDLPRSGRWYEGMVNRDIETDLDITNGMRGEIVDIVLHPDEDVPVGASEVRLKHLPLYILVKLSRTRASTLEGNGRKCDTSGTYQHKLLQRDTKTGKKQSLTVQRRRFPLTAAHAFTDYRAQGQTL